MPFIHVRLFEDRSLEQKRGFADAVTRDAVRTLKCPSESVDIVFNDVRCSDLASAGCLAAGPATA